MGPVDQQIRRLTAAQQRQRCRGSWMNWRSLPLHQPTPAAGATGPSTPLRRHRRRSRRGPHPGRPHRRRSVRPAPAHKRRDIPTPGRPPQRQAGTHLADGHVRAQCQQSPAGQSSRPHLSHPHPLVHNADPDPAAGLPRRGRSGSCARRVCKPLARLSPDRSAARASRRTGAGGARPKAPDRPRPPRVRTAAPPRARRRPAHPAGSR